MLLDILLDEVASEVRDRTHIRNTTDNSILYLNEQLARYRDKELSTFHAKRAGHMLDVAQKNPVHAAIDVEQQLQAMMDKFETAIAAFTPAGPKPPERRNKLGRPDQTSEGCWHCGIKGHTRRECHTLQ